MCIQSIAIDRAIVSVKPEADPKKQTGKSALVKAHALKNRNKYCKPLFYPQKRSKDYRILEVLLAFTRLIHLKTPTSLLQNPLAHAVVQNTALQTVIITKNLINNLLY